MVLLVNGLQLPEDIFRVFHVEVVGAALEGLSYLGTIVLDRFLESLG